MRNCTITKLGEVYVQSCGNPLILVAFIFFLVVSFLIFLVVRRCRKSDRFFGAIDENKNLDIGLYIRNHRSHIRRLKTFGKLEEDYPSWPQNVVLPYRPWDNENQVPIY